MENTKLPESLEIGMYVVTHSNQVVEITSDDMPNYKYEDFKRLATKEEIKPFKEQLKISLIEGCFSSKVLINGHQLTSKEDKLELLNELIENVDHLNDFDIKNIAEILVSKDNFLFVKEESSEGECEQCGHYDSNYVYIKK